MPRNSFYTSASPSEANMRQEMVNTLDGLFPEVSKKQRGVIRKMRRDSSDDLIPCACRSLVTNEGDIDDYCPYCLGSGFYWDEMWADFYKMIIRSDVGNATRETLIAPGNVNVEVAVFFFRHSYELTKDDKIVEIILNNDGTVYYPYKRKAIYRIDGLIPLRADNGKLEFWKAACYDEDTRFLNGPEG